MKINTTDFGELEINPEAVLNFPQGLAGFENCKSYQLLHEETEGPVVHYMQSLDDPAIAFSIVDPALFGFNYEITLTDEEVALLQVENVSDLAVVLIVYKPDGAGKEAVTQGGVAANINGPLVLNPGKKLGLQKVLLGPKCNITLRDATA